MGVRTLCMMVAVGLLVAPGHPGPPAPQAAPGRVAAPTEREGPKDTARRRSSDEGRFDVAIKALATPIPINRIHNWSVRVARPDGTPVIDASIGFDGGMPDHNHGFPTEPRVTRHIGNGTYLIEGVKFNMSGWWRFEFEIRDGDVADRVGFDVVLKD